MRYTLAILSILINLPFCFSQTTNLVSNGNFASGATGWTLTINDPSENGSTGAVVNAEYKTTVAATGSLAWYLQLTHGAIALTQGKNYMLSFDAYASASRTLSTNVSSGPSAYTSFSGETTHSITLPLKKHIQRLLP
jgi:hypothetical protein